jgi:hypothetical protein
MGALLSCLVAFTSNYERPILPHNGHTKFGLLQKKKKIQRKEQKLLVITAQKSTGHDESWAGKMGRC